MEDKIIGLETSKLANKKGFNIPCINYWDESYKKVRTFSEPVNFTGGFGCHNAPTQPLLQKWLREVHDLNIIPPLYFGDRGYLCSIAHYRYARYSNTYEEALEKELQKTLKNII